MRAHSTSDDQPYSEGTIQLPDGQVIDWRYLMFAKGHPVRWPHRTEVLWGSCHPVNIDRFATTYQVRIGRITAGQAFTTANHPIVDAWLTTPLTHHRRGEVANCQLLT